jgi:hypothetical protein
MSDSDEEEIVDTAEFLTDWVEQVSREPLRLCPMPAGPRGAGIISSFFLTLIF